MRYTEYASYWSKNDPRSMAITKNRTSHPRVPKQFESERQKPRYNTTRQVMMFYKYLRKFFCQMENITESRKASLCPSPNVTMIPYKNQTQHKTSRQREGFVCSFHKINSSHRSPLFGCHNSCWTRYIIRSAWA